MPRRRAGKGTGDSLSLRQIQQRNLELERGRRRVILARTKAGRARIADLAQGADMRDVDHLPVMEKTRITGRTLTRGKHKRVRKRTSDGAPGTTAVPTPEFLARMRGDSASP